MQISRSMTDLGIDRSEFALVFEEVKMVVTFLFEKSLNFSARLTFRALSVTQTTLSLDSRFN
jgi:hypothetical protein